MTSVHTTSQGGKHPKSGDLASRAYDPTLQETAKQRQTTIDSIGRPMLHSASCQDTVKLMLCRL